MQIYLNAIFNHFRAIQAWAGDKDAKITLDLKNFELEVKYRGRYFMMYPIFQARAEGLSMHTSMLSPSVFGFGGWRPYQSFTHGHSTDKRLFKTFLTEAGLRTPASLQVFDGVEPPSFDYILKGAVGSFGKEIEGPFRAGTPLQQVRGGAAGSRESVFAEQFIQGRILKVWFWGSRPFFAHAHEFPVIRGDGVRKVEDIVRERVAQGGQDWEKDTDREVVRACLRFQRTEWDSVLEIGAARWIDYRYSQHYEKSAGVTAITDSALPELVSQGGEQIERMGKELANLLRKTVAAPVMISVDGMMDADGHIWWLEMNTNSIAPPELYAPMFSDLFF